MKTSLALLVAFTSAAFAADPELPQTRIAQIEKLALGNPVEGSTLAKEWKAAKGKWEVADGAMRGAELAADKHGGVIRTALKLQNLVIAYEVKLDGAKTTSLSINGPKDHLARIIVAPNRFAVQRDDQDHEGPDKAVVFLSKEMKLEPGTWHTVVLEMVGDKMVGTLDGKITGEGSDPTFAANLKSSPGFTVAGESASFRNVHIYTAKAEPKK
ncbi:MAG: family 16 glycoside hydrolase [Chthoniobacteraceae bacterium]